MKSLDPRVTRLPVVGEGGPLKPKAALDQFGTFEVFVQPREGKPFQHEGIVHAPNPEMAFVLAKETFTRRFTCASLYVVETRKINVSATTEGNLTAYDRIDNVTPQRGEKFNYEIYHLPKRGKQHIHAGTVVAGSPAEAMFLAGKKFDTGKIVFNIWVVRTDDIRFTAPDENNFWITLPEKKFRDAAEYKGGEKLKEFLATRNHQAK